MSASAVTSEMLPAPFGAWASSGVVALRFTPDPVEHSPSDPFVGPNPTRVTLLPTGGRVVAMTMGETSTCDDAGWSRRSTARSLASQPPMFMSGWTTNDPGMITFCRVLGLLTGRTLTKVKFPRATQPLVSKSLQTQCAAVSTTESPIRVPVQPPRPWIRPTASS